MNPNILKAFTEKFSVKIFTIYATFMLLISSSFTCFFIYHETKTLTEALKNKGSLLVKVLAYNSRIGVFSENEELLRLPVEGVIQQGETLEAWVFNREGEVLTNQKRAGINIPEKPVKEKERIRKEIFERLERDPVPIFLDKGDTLEFWSPVTSSGVTLSWDDSLLFEEGLPPKKDRIIGFVKVTLDKKILNKQIKDLLLRAVLIGLVFMILGSGIVYFVVERVTRPLNRLTEAVKTLGKEGVAERVPVETRDEVGRLADAFNDMTESLKKREEEKRVLEEELRHAQKMEAIGTLAGGIAHDFNNILTAIMGYATLLEMKMGKDNPLRSYVEHILTSGEKAANLTQRILAFSRKQLIQPRPINLNAHVENVKKLLERLVREDITINLQLAQQDLTVMADPGQIDQVIINLATNARDAMPDGGVLTIATESVKLERNFFKAQGPEKPGRYALLALSDTGTGMDEEIREKIFEPFFTTKRFGEGTGLGLSMVYGIVKQHGGFIDVSSKCGEGTTFRIYLPMIERTLERNKKEKTQDFLPERGTQTVLIAEDDESVRILSKEVLTQHGYKVIEAIDGEDALRKFIKNKEKIELLLLDVIMPKKNGKEVHEEIMRIRPDIKALFISGYASDIIHKKGVVEEGLNFISKPILPEVLLRKVKEVLEQ
nr:hybrid sensor histidine kinase/response regulator [Desulfobacterales bacterium]